MDEEKPSEEKTEIAANADDKEIINRDSQDNSVVREESAESDDSVDKEEINVEKPDEQPSQDNELNTPELQEKPEDSASEQKEIVNEEKTSMNDENINEEANLDNNSNQSNEPASEQSEKKEETPEEPAPKGVPSDEGKEKKPEEKPSDKTGKEGSFMPMVFIMIISLVIAFAWDKVPVIQNSVHAVLDPTAGFLLNWNLTAGMLLIVFTITVLTTIIQKYATDQKALKELKKEQKILQAEMKKYKDHPEKVAELSKKQFQFIPKTFKLTSRAIMFTGIPFILFFRWFSDVFILMEATTGAPIKFLGFLSWFWFYLIFTMVFSSILRKTLKVV